MGPAPSRSSLGENLPPDLPGRRDSCFCMGRGATTIGVRGALQPGVEVGDYGQGSIVLPAQCLLPRGLHQLP